MPFVAPIIPVIAGAAATAAGIGAVAVAAITVATTVLSTVIFSQRADQKRPSQRDPGVPVSVRQPINPRRRLYGLKRIGAVIVHAQLFFRNSRLLVIAALSEGPCRGPVRVYFNDEIVWRRNGGATPISGMGLNTYGTWQNGWSNFVERFVWYDGTQTAAAAYFVDRSRQGSDQPHDANVSVILTAPSGIQVTEAQAQRTGTITNAQGGEELETYDVTEVRASWQAALGGTVTQYRVRYHADNGTRSVVYVDGQTTELVLGTTPRFRASSARVSVSAQDTSGNWTDAIDSQGGALTRLRTWGDDRIGTGISYFATELVWDRNRNRFPRGLPNITVEMEGASDIVDPRDGSVGYLKNAALVLRHYLLDRVCGLGAIVSEMDDVKWAAQATLSDELVDTSTGGSEPRFEAHGLVQADEARDGTIVDLGATGGLDTVFSNGRFAPVNGDVAAVSMTITDDNLVDEPDWAIGRGRAERFNSVIGTFRPPQTRYVDASYPSVQDADAIAEDGREIPKQMPLNFVNSPGQAQRLGWAALRESRKRRFVKIPLGMTALQAEIGDTIAWTSAMYGFAGQQFRVDGVTLGQPKPSADGKGLFVPILLTCSEVDPDQWVRTQSDLSDFDPDVPDENDTEPMPGPILPVLQITQRQTGDGTTVTQSVVTWGEAPSEAAVAYEVVYRLEGQTTSSVVQGTRLEVDRGISNVTVAAVGADGQKSVPVAASVPVSYVIVDQDPPAAPVLAAPIAANTLGQVVVNLEEPPDADFAFHRLYAHTANNFAAAQLVATSDTTRLVTRELNFNTNYWFWITAVDHTRNESAALAAGSARPSDIVIDTPQLADNAVTEEETVIVNSAFPFSSQGSNAQTGALIMSTPINLNANRIVTFRASLRAFSGNGQNSIQWIYRLQRNDGQLDINIRGGELQVPTGEQVRAGNVENITFEQAIPQGNYRLEMRGRRTLTSSNPNCSVGSFISYRYWKK